MDVLSLLASARVAHGAIKAAVSLGKDIHSTAKDLSALWSSVASLTQAAADPPKGGFLSNGSAEARALEIFAAKKEAEQLQTEVENFIISEWGLTGLDALRQEITNQKKLDKQRKLEDQKAQAALIDAVIFYLIMGLITLGFLSSIFILLYLLH